METKQIGNGEALSSSQGELGENNELSNEVNNMNLDQINNTVVDVEDPNDINTNQHNKDNNMEIIDLGQEKYSCIEKYFYAVEKVLMSCHAFEDEWEMTKKEEDKIESILKKLWILDDINSELLPPKPVSETEIEQGDEEICHNHCVHIVDGIADVEKEYSNLTKLDLTEEERRILKPVSELLVQIIDETIDLFPNIMMLKNDHRIEIKTKVDCLVQKRTQTQEDN